MFDKNKKSCVKFIYLVTDDGLYDQKAFHTVEKKFIHPLGGDLYQSYIVVSIDKSSM